MDPLYLIYDLARGPFVWAAVIIFLAGAVFQIYRMWSLTSKIEPPIDYPSYLRKENIKKKKLPLTARIRLSIAGTSPVTIVVTTLFHLCLVITPLFVLGHNIMLDNAWGVSLVSLPEGFADILTLIVIIGATYFLIRRIFLKRVRIISNVGDYVFLALAAGPFITGYLAYHQTFDYTLVITLHIIIGELMLIAIPFTKFVHMLFFFIFRFAVASEYSLGNGNRKW